MRIATDAGYCIDIRKSKTEPTEMLWTAIRAIIQDALSLDSFVVELIQTGALAALLAFLGWYWNKFMRAKRPNKMKAVPFWTLAAVCCFFCISFLASLRHSSDSNGATNIRASVRRCQIQANPNKQNSTDVLFMIRMANSGQASTVWAWRATAITRAGIRFQAQAPDLPITFVLSNKTTTNTFQSTQYLPVKLLTESVSRENGADGWVYFDFDKVPFSQIGEPGTQFVIEYEQAADGVRRTVEHLWPGPGI